MQILFIYWFYTFSMAGQTRASPPQRPYHPSFLSLVPKPHKLWASVLRIGTDFENLNFMLNLSQLPIFLGLVFGNDPFDIDKYLSDYHTQAKQ